MAYPPTLSVITVTGTYLNGDGTAPFGTVRFSTTVKLTSSTSVVAVQPGVQTVELDSNGHFSIALPASNDPDWIPNPFTYTVTEQLNTRGVAATYSVQIPFNAPGNTVDLSTLAPIPPVINPNVYVLLSQVGVANGVASLDGTGNVPVSQLGNVAGQSPSNTVVTETSFGQGSAAGAATAYSRGDHTHGTPAAPSIPTASGTVVSETGFGQSTVAGVATAYSRGDHSHGSPSLSSTIPLQGQGDAIVGVGTTAAKADHEHGLDSPMHLDHSLLAWTLPSWTVNSTAVAPTVGTVYFAKVFLPVSITVTTIWFNVATAGVTLTAGQNFFALYSSAGALLNTTADQTTNWGSTGTKSTAITSTVLPAGFAYVAFFSNGATGVRFAAAMNGSLLSAGAVSPNFVWGNTADTGRTTTMPANLTAPFVGYNSAVWFGLA